MIAVKLLSWSKRHAIIMLTGSVLLPFFGFPIELLSLMAIISFGLLVASSRGRWTPNEQFGYANWVTLVRLLLVLLLVIIGADKPDWIIIIAVVVLCLDGIDGYLARKFSCASEFGEFFDKETDAFFMLQLCWLLYLDQRLGAWILFPGLMRYLFVLFLMITKPPIHKEPQTAAGKIIFVVTVIILIFCFTDYAHIYYPLALAMTLLLIYSFADSIRMIYLINKHESNA